jgi:hypothetical protein
VTASANSRALAAALSLGLPAFPCRRDKAPACPHGFRDATVDPCGLGELWRLYPGPLVGVPTGEASGLDALDLDKKHPEARQWWSDNRHHLPQTRTHRSRSGGLHLLFQHAPSLRCWTGRPVIGIDGRASGGFIIWWRSAGYPVLCDAPPVPWPEWLIDELSRHSPAIPSVVLPRAPAPSRYRVGSRYAGAALRNAAERIARAPIGCRNASLNAEAYRVGRLVVEGLLEAQEVADVLAAAAVAAGLGPWEIQATLRSALRARGLL